MAGRKREPADLVKAKGRSHLSRKEYDDKKSSELYVPFVDVKPPDCLTTKKQKQEFNDIAEKLLALNIFTELDIDALARYILSRELYIDFTRELKRAMNHSEVDWNAVKSLQSMQDRAYRQCVTSANELCLNVTSRAKLVIPQPQDGEDDEL